MTAKLTLGQKLKLFCCLDQRKTCSFTSDSMNTIANFCYQSSKPMKKRINILQTLKSCQANASKLLAATALWKKNYFHAVESFCTHFSAKQLIQMTLFSNLHYIMR